MDNVAIEEASWTCHVHQLPELQEGGKAVLCKSMTYNGAYKKGKDLLNAVTSVENMKLQKRRNLELKAVLRAVVSHGRAKVKELSGRCKKFEVMGCSVAGGGSL